MTVILGALEGEVACIVDALEPPSPEQPNALGRSSEQWNQVTLHCGALAGAPVVVAATGVGKTLSAMVCQHLIDRYAPRRIIGVGIAGALNDAYQIGDTVIARECVHHDMDVRVLGFARGEIPHAGVRMIRSDPALVALASRLEPPDRRSHVGRMLTGDQFIADVAGRDQLREELGGDAVDMETASVGLVALVNGIPFLAIRTISDRADGTTQKNFRAFLARSSQNAHYYLSRIMMEVD